MDALIVIILILFLVFFYSTINKLRNAIGDLENKVDTLLNEFHQWRTDKPQSTPQVRPIPETPKPIATAIPKPIPAPPKKEKPIEVIVQKETITPPVVATKPLATPAPSQPKQPSFFERNPDLEKFIGENLANKIGIAVLVIGIGFFVKYAIDQDWINEIGRVALGIACGGGLIAVAHRLRKSLPAFSAVLIGGGIAILYLTIAIAFHEYNLFSATVAFIFMVFITGFAIIFSLLYNRMELAVLAILGGFGSPFMVSTGEGNYLILFTYIVVLDIGMLVLAYYKRWTTVNVIAYALTWILFIGWHINEGMIEEPTKLWSAFLYAFIFYTLFFFMSIINQWKNKSKFNGLEIGILLSNTFVFYAQGMLLLDTPATISYQGMFTISLALINFSFVYLLYKRENIDKNLIYLLIGLVLTFVSLAAPVQLEGNFITLFWAAEAVLVLWLAQKSGIQLMRYTSIVVSVLMVFSLLLDYQQVYAEGTSLMVILNKAYITSIVAILSAYGCYLLWKRETVSHIAGIPIPLVYIIVAGAFFYLAHFLEIRHHLRYHEVYLANQNIILGCWNLFCLAALQWFFVRKESLRNHKVVIGITALMAILYLAFYHHQIIDARDAYVVGQVSSVGVLFHYILILLALVIWYHGLKKMQTFSAFNTETYNLYAWVFITFLLILLSSELNNAVVLLAYSSTTSIAYILQQTSKIGFPILWGVASFVIIYIGLKAKKKHLRVISLTVFLITLLKLFLFDLRGISEGGKIAAFISLGVLLLIISFMYQRLKKVILMEDETLANNLSELND